jgi:MFS family permease
MVVIGTIFGAFQDPASSAIITMLVPDEKRDLANTVQQVRGPAASILSPIIASLLFVVVGVVGVMAIDMLSFLVAVAVIGSVHIPHPEQTDVGREAKGSVLREAWSGFQFLFARRVLFYTILYAMSLNFLFNMAGVMLTPFVLTLFDSEATLGLVMSALSAGPLVGGIAFGAWKRNVGRIHVIFIAIILMGLFMGLMGLARNPYLLVFLAFITLLPNPAANASLMSLMQIKTPPDMQGRVFAAIMQLAMLATPLAYLLAGPLADQVLEPAVGTSGWEVVEPLVGSDAGAGMGLLMFVNGMIIVVTGLLLYATPKMRSLEASLPDYAPVIQNQNTDEVAYGAEHPSTPHPSPSM